MGSVIASSSDDPALPPQGWRSPLQSQLQVGERLVAWFVPDLDARLHFSESFVALTDRRVLHGLSPSDWKSWPLTPDSTITVRDRSGLCTLELLEPDARLAHWRFTLAKGAAAHRFVEHFDALRRGISLEEEAPEERPCPSCGDPIPFGQVECPACSKVAAIPPTASLFRLVRFAKPRMLPIVVGFVLTLASTAASLIPIVLSVPLIDDVLVPGKHFDLVKWYLLGLAGRGDPGLALELGADVRGGLGSERIASDLGIETYEHLQKLSLEYFGGKRTGDLMSRLSTDTDRICNFLSINLLDFATDVLMIVMTAVHAGRASIRCWRRRRCCRFRSSPGSCTRFAAASATAFSAAAAPGPR